MIIGHRGASGYRPEHTRAAFELAFALGADAVEPDIVPTRDGVLVVRHENEISGTTDVADRPEFADRRTTKEFLGHRQTGWFTEDFIWAELSALRARERVPGIRPSNSEYDDRYPVLRLADLFPLVEEASATASRPLGLVVELKHASYFESIGLPLDELFDGELADAGWANDPRLVVESFELTVLAQLRRRGPRARQVFLLETQGAPLDLVAAHGSTATPYAAHLGRDGLQRLAKQVNGISVDKALLMQVNSEDEIQAATAGADTGLVAAAHSALLDVFCWTLRPENAYLHEAFQTDAGPGAFGRWRDEFALVMNTGVDGVFADHPDLAALVRDELDPLTGCATATVIP